MVALHKIKTIMKKPILSVAFALFGSLISFSSWADDFIVITHEGKVFDQPNAKSYSTTNKDGEDVVISDGMVFKKKESRQGWDMIEYSPGLNGFILQSLEATPGTLKTPSPGVLPIANNSGVTADIKRDGDNWSATVNGHKYAGQLHDNVVVFFSAHGDIILSLVNKGGKNLVFSYDNDVTHFF